MKSLVLNQLSQPGAPDLVFLSDLSSVFTCSSQEANPAWGEAGEALTTAYSCSPELDEANLWRVFHSGHWAVFPASEVSLHPYSSLSQWNAPLVAE